MEQPKEQPATKTAYQAPKLVRYGDLVEVTQTIVRGAGMSDAFKGSNKTA